jgi:hypothetical protein
MKRTTILLNVLALATIAGCANVQSTYTLDPTKGNGLLVGTITYENFGGEYYVTARRTGDPKTVIRLSVGNPTLLPFAKIFDDDLKMRGDTFAVEAPAGEYSLGKWYIRKGQASYSSARELGVSFKVESGKATYLGNIHYVGTDTVNLQEMAQRDLPILQARFQALKDSPVAFTLAQGTKLEGLGGEATRKTIIPIFIPVPVAPR